MTVRDLFVNHHGEMRSGWRAALYVVLVVLIASGLQVILKPLHGTAAIIGPLLFLASVLLASNLMTRYVNHKPFTAIGLSLHPTTFSDFGIGCLVGLVMASMVFVVEYLLGYMNFAWRGLPLINVVGVFAYGLVFFAAAALAEEVFFRGYLFQSLIQGITFVPAMLLMSLVFAFVHRFNPNASTFGLINVALAGIWLSIAYMKTRSLWLPFGLHFSWNFAQTVIFSFPTSGIDFTGYQLGMNMQTGPEWITGGAFGPEGGALATIILMLSSWYILKSRKLATPEGIVTLDSVEDLVEAQEKPAAEKS